jgi:hypothetical protein
MPVRRPATRAEYDNMNDLHRTWYLNGVPILLTTKDGITRSMISGNHWMSHTAGQGPHWNLAEADAIIVRPQGYRNRDADDHRVALIHQPDYAKPDTADLSPYLLE